MAKVNREQLKQIVEAAVFVAEQPVNIDKLRETVLADFDLSHRQVQLLLGELQKDYENKGIHLVKTASGYRFQSDGSLNTWVSKLWQEPSQKYSRAMLETLSLIAYRQPITRGEIEQVRGVSVSSHIIKTLTERNWIKVIGHKEVAGRPALYATTNGFLDYFGLESLRDLPSSDMFADTEQNKMPEDEQALLEDAAPLFATQEQPHEPQDAEAHSDPSESSSPDTLH